ncbi:hypothetical protein H9P43_002114 [Blastocladiella emersonii ATCC 22665]|nr:hypothetical protein H9P43_002114 [Blastocladiella emersonii ATCC 22665]
MFAFNLIISVCMTPPPREERIRSSHLDDLKPGTPGVDALPPHKLRTGDIVALENHSSSDRPTSAKPADGGSGKAGSATSGVVYRVTEAKITLVLDDDPSDELSEKLRIIRLANEITYKRLQATLRDLTDAVDGKHPAAQRSSLPRVLLGLGAPSFDESSTKPLKLFNPDLNASQKEAVRFALTASDVALIHGPPGTGKTQTLIEIVRQLVARGEKVLFCGPSNISVDNVVERLAPTKLPVLRIGHPARVLPSVLAHCLDVRVRTCDEGQIVADVVRDIDTKLAGVRKTRSRVERRAIYADVKLLRKEQRAREANVVANLLTQAKVVLTTLNGAGSRKLGKYDFDTVIIDECAQALEPECWTALLKGRRAILAGDHLQLPPTIKASTGTTAGVLATTLFERLMQRHGDAVARLLSVQYRMHADIMGYSSAALYDGKLEAHDTVAAHVLPDLPHLTDTEDTRATLVLIDTAGCDLLETRGDADGANPLAADSKCNEGEADLVVAHVRTLVEAGLPPRDVVVLTPYNAQVALIKDCLRATAAAGDLPAAVVGSTEELAIEVGSIDGMQGREKEAVVISLVRSNDAREVGFLAERRRLNVAITRARRHLCVICDSETVSTNEFCRGLVEYMSEHGDLRYPGY